MDFDDSGVPGSGQDPLESNLTVESLPKVLKNE